MKTGRAEKRVKRNEKMAASERLTNGYMLCLTYGLGAIVLLEIVRRHYLMYLSAFDADALNFANMFCIVCGIIFAMGAAAVAILGGFKTISVGRVKTYTITFVIASLVSFFLSFDVRVPLSSKLLASKSNWGMFDFLANLNLANDAKYIEYGVVGFLIIAFIIYAIRLTGLEKKK